MQCVSFSVLGELHLRTNFAECREIEGLRLRDSKNYRFGKKEKKTNKNNEIINAEFQIFSTFGFANNLANSSARENIFNY